MIFKYNFVDNFSTANFSTKAFVYIYLYKHILWKIKYLSTVTLRGEYFSTFKLWYGK